MRINKKGELKDMNIENSFWFRHFLMCSRVANEMMSARGWHVDNFAQSIIESENGCLGNEQMNVYFAMADKFFSELHCSDEDEVFNALEDDGVSMQDLAKLSVEEIEEYYYKYCVGAINFSEVCNERT